MKNATLASAFGFALALASLSGASAQPGDPLTKFLDGILKTAPAEQPAEVEPEPVAPTPEPVAQPVPQPQAKRVPKVAPAPVPPAQAVAAPKPLPVAPTPSEAAKAPIEAAAPVEQVAMTPPPLPPRRPADLEAGTPVQTASADPKEAIATVQPAAVSRTPSQAVPTSPDAALARVNAFFNTIDVMTASFTQESGTGQRSEGNLYIKHPGQLRFAYSPPSTLEIVSDGRSVAVRDKKLGTNDVYSANQTPLKFLMQDKFNLARDTKVQDVQTRSDGTVLVSFEDSATLGGTSKVTLMFDSKANKLKQWVILDAQGFRTTVKLSDVNVVQRAGDAAVQ